MDIGRGIIVYIINDPEFSPDVVQVAILAIQEDVQ